MYAGDLPATLLHAIQRCDLMAHNIIAAEVAFLCYMTEMTTQLLCVTEAMLDNVLTVE